MGDVTMPGCSDAAEEPLDIAGLFNEGNPTLNLDDDTVIEDFLYGTLQLDNGNQFDWDTEKYPVMNHNNNGVEGENPEYVGNMGNEVETIPVWPPVSTPFNCSYCQVLREIIHQNGMLSMKLEIHGRIGFICHAVYETRTNVIDAPPTVKYQMFDLTTQSMDSVKQFIVEYCQDRARQGYAIMQNPSSIFYDALCYGLDANDDRRPPRPDLGIQRQRTKTITLDDLTRWFHVPRKTAAKKLEICETVLKNKCWEFGVERWPSRKVKSYNKKISALEESIREGTSKPNASREIENLRKKLQDIYACRRTSKTTRKTQ